MEFTYRISESEYVRALRTAIKVSRASLWKTIVFWVFLVVCLMLLFGVISQTNHNRERQRQSQVDDIENAPVSPRAPNILEPVIKQTFPWLLILACWMTILFVVPSFLSRRRYRKDPNVHGDIAVKIDTQSFELRTANSLVQSRWNVFKNWTEKKDFVLLQYHSGLFHILVVSGLDEGQRLEMRGILSDVLTKR